MNLFILDQNPEKNAQYHVDKHCGKMILESVQVLCTTFHESGYQAPYRSTHKNHPVCKFARKSLANFDFVVNYAEALANEFEYRYGKVHKSSLILPWIKDNKHKLPFNQSELTEFAQAMPEQYKNEDAVKAYRDYYIGEKQKLFKWTKRPKPEWIND